MAKSREIRCYNYVNHPYQEVHDALTGDALVVFKNATSAASSRAESVAAALRVNIGGIEVGTEVDIQVTHVDKRDRAGSASPCTRLSLEWAATKSPRLFPIMKADLAIYPLTATETQLDFQGHYDPPLGPLGSAVDALVGHKIAEASVHRFVDDVAEYLRKTLKG